MVEIRKNRINKKTFYCCKEKKEKFMKKLKRTDNNEGKDCLENNWIYHKEKKVTIVLVST